MNIMNIITKIPRHNLLAIWVLKPQEVCKLDNIFIRHNLLAIWVLKPINLDFVTPTADTTTRYMGIET